ncbi:MULTISPECIES: NAD(+) kinase [Methanobacterium]|jgi:NAD+ kinase|uniref:NAD kinase n=1 Tax=Methanobacterium subterraneum TaxID=59277 RepID=A0A7K4DLI5_9EURY|nr:MULTISPECIES: NAD(+) kinase [Methanobacterium]AUB58191.1 NAD(+) kinase [Methanobacterium sp. MZ-A1]MBW4256835.1 NAD(+) kinase [Methanobacterium sp. YSL]NMO08744.1 NAD(+) kinase [Methanobacterium subterraneum]
MIMGLVARSDVKGAVELALKIADFLTEKKVDILLDMPIAMELEKYQDQRCELEEMDVDMVIAIGGDGTILRTQSFISHKKIPLIGINMGTVGFLTEIDPENAFTAIEEILAGNYFVERRNQLLVWHNHELPPALNEVVLMTRKPAKMLHIQISVDDEIMEELRADGLIIATPSGSTAYSMSAGGPIIDPKVKAFIIVPICPFKLGARPTVVSDESIIKVKLLREGKKAVAVIDGQFEEEINYMDEIIFRKSDNCAYFVRLTKDFYRKVREKLTQGGIS